MSAELTGELLDRDLIERHDALMKQFARGAFNVCVALFWIREEETYRARGYDSWKAFVLGATGLSESNARDYANVGPLYEALAAAGEAGLIRHPDMLKPIAGMLSLRKKETRPGSVQRMLRIVRQAAARSRHEMVPLDANLIADCARSVGWEPRGRRKRAEDDRPKTPDEMREDMRHHIELAIGVIVDYRRGGAELEREIRITKIAGFDLLREIVNDAYDSQEF